jgi:hypothetical protein
MFYTSPAITWVIAGFSFSFIPQFHGAAPVKISKAVAHTKPIDEFNKVFLILTAFRETGSIVELK